MLADGFKAVFFFFNVIMLLLSYRSVEDGLESEYKQKLESVWYPEANTEKLHFSWKRMAVLFVL